MKQIFQTRPFDPLGKHRYFFKGNSSKREPDSDTVSFDVRIEQGINGKSCENFRGLVALVSNLLWFQWAEGPSGHGCAKTIVLKAFTVNRHFASGMAVENSLQQIISPGC
jgi:hypothetical protein